MHLSTASAAGRASATIARWCAAHAAGRRADWSERTASRRVASASIGRAARGAPIKSNDNRREQPTARAATAPYTLAELLLYFVRLGTFGLGGPIALVGYMQRDIVEGRRYFSKRDYVEGSHARSSRPDRSAQLAIWFGWLKAGTLGASLVAAAFVLPSLALSAVYLAFGGLAWMQGAFYGVGAAVIAIIGRSAWKLMRSDRRGRPRRVRDLPDERARDRVDRAASSATWWRGRSARRWLPSACSCRAGSSSSCPRRAPALDRQPARQGLLRRRRHRGGERRDRRRGVRARTRAIHDVPTALIALGTLWGS